MNAQEAMKYIEREIRHLSKGIEYKVPSEREMLEDYIEAFSIVLESARLLHSKGINPDTTSNGALVIERFINEKDFEKLGIEEGEEK